MKAIIEFNLDDFEDEQALKRCVVSSEMANIIWELRHNFLRQFKESDCITYEDLQESIDDLIGDINIDSLTG